MHLESGISILSDVLVGSPILGGDVNNQYGGNEMDMMDEDLQMVLRISAEEAKQKEEEDRKKVEGGDQEQPKAEGDLTVQAGETNKMQEENVQEGTDQGTQKYFFINKTF